MIGVLGVFFGIYVYWYLWKFGKVYLKHDIEHLIFGIAHMVIFVLCGKSTPAGKKYTSGAGGAGGAGDKSQLCPRLFKEKSGPLLLPTLNHTI